MIPVGAVARVIAVARTPSCPCWASALPVDGATALEPPDGALAEPPPAVTVLEGLPPPAVGIASTYWFAPELPGGITGTIFAPAAAGPASINAPVAASPLIA